MIRTVDVINISDIFKQDQIKYVNGMPVYKGGVNDLGDFEEGECWRLTGNAGGRGLFL